MTLIELFPLGLAAVGIALRFYMSMPRKSAAAAEAVQVIVKAETRRAPVKAAPMREQRTAGDALHA